MTLLKVQKDRLWFIQEERLRFPVDAGVSRELVPIVVFKDLQRSIDILEKLRGWRYIDTWPSHVRVSSPCCPQVASARPGEAMKMRFEPSALQGDTDDVHNSGMATTGEDRLIRDYKVDWVAIMHFWVPGIIEDPDDIREYKASLTEKDGFVSPELLPKELLAVSKRYKNDDNGSSD